MLLALAETSHGMIKQIHYLQTDTDSSVALMQKLLKPAVP